MQSTVILCGVALVLCVVSSYAQQSDFDDFTFEKRTPMRNALVRFGRAGMRNALVRFGKRSAISEEYPVIPEYALEAKRNGAPQPFVRFGRSAGRIDHMHDILNTLQKLELANSQ